MAGERKEKVLHTRVPAVLEEELKKLAENLRVPVSNVVRTILEDAVQTVDTVGEMAEDQVRHVADRLGRRRERFRKEHPAGGEAASAQPPLAGIIGYQELRLARTERCTLCGADLEAGARAWLGVREAPGRRVLLDETCLPFSAASAATPPSPGGHDDP